MAKLPVSIYVSFAPSHFRYPWLLFAFPGNYPPSFSTEIQSKTFVTLGISTSVIISDLEPIASAIITFQRSFFHSENFQMVTVCTVSLAIHMITRYSESQAVIELLVT